MSRRNSIILGLLFGILVIEILILAPKEIGSFEDSPADAAKVGQSEESEGAGRSGQIMKDVHSVEARKNGKEWELWAASAHQPNPNQVWTIERVKVKFYGADGVIYTVAGREGQVSPNEKGVRDLRVSGSVETRSSNGYVFRSEAVFYDSLTKKLTSHSAIEMRAPPDKDGGRMVLTGSDMVADLETNEIAVNKSVHTTKELKDGKKLVISSDRAVFSGKTKMAYFLGNVVITYDTMTLSGPEARFAYDRSGQVLQSVHVSGGIRVTDTDRFAVSKSVSVDFINDEVVFRGSPRVTQKGDQLSGDEIVFMKGGSKVRVKNARARIESIMDEEDAGTDSESKLQ